MRSPSPFGKVLRKFRIDADLTTDDLARVTGVTRQFISYMELGVKPVPMTFIETVMGIYPKVASERATWIALADQQMREIHIPLHTCDTSHHDLAIMFSRRFATLTDAQVSKIKSILNKEAT